MADERGHIVEASVTAETADLTDGASVGGATTRVEAEPARTGGPRQILPLNSR